MENYRDFLGNDLDECIARATEYFGCPREGLEIELVQDAKSGIFGIVGARKAKIRARRLRVNHVIADLLENKGTKSESAGTAPECSENRLKMPEQPSGAEVTQAARNDRTGQQPAISAEISSPEDAEPREDMESTSSWSEIPLKDLDQSKLESKLLEILEEIVRAITGKQVPIRIDLAHANPRAIIDWKGDAGLLIGREGQTLAAIQYLASRMLSHAMEAALRVQIDIGHYRSRQDDNLREMAKALAKKVRLSGKPLTTRPLSSYHRRVIHICLQPDPDVQTKSIGEGQLKRVLISPKRICPQL